MKVFLSSVSGRFLRGSTFGRLLIVVVAFGLSSQITVAQKKSDEKDAARGTPVLWRAPDDIVTRDLFWGPGGERMQPDLSNGNQLPRAMRENFRRAEACEGG
jgi:hypothetical protein